MKFLVHFVAFPLRHLLSSKNAIKDEEEHSLARTHAILFGARSEHFVISKMDIASKQQLNF